MTNQQLYLAIGAPLIFNAVMIGLVVAMFSSKFDALATKFSSRFETMDAKFSSRLETMDAKFSSKFESIDSNFDAVNTRLDAIDRRFDDMRDLWRAELHRVEEVFDARLKHLEER